ncbi:MAG TPA: 5'-nucleotidase C-terminal domain-containing protein [Polyangiaceae bacterium]|nr:5'-nucleotidase C-terminal domain-containing protein [Polyangiaceae bacterium]
MAACGGEDRTQILPQLSTGGAGGNSSAPAAGAGTAGLGGTAGAPDDGPRAPQKLLLLHTNDIHSHLMGFGPERDYTPATTNDDATHGGFARLASAIGRARASAAAADRAVLQLDAGDFMMGTLFELLGTLEAPELRMMQALGYDATTLGNHEFDWTPAGLAAILQAAGARQVSLPILSSNLQFSSSDPGDDALAALVQSTGALRAKLVKNVGGLKVGLFGLLGANASQVTPQARPLTFEPIADAAERMVRELREVDDVDLVIALSHSGIDAQGHGEDADLAAAVPGIDIIVSGHTHDVLPQPAQVGDTLIVTAGSYSGYLGELALTVTPAASPGGRARVALDDYMLLDIDDSIPGDATTQAGLEQFVQGLDAALGIRHLGYRQVVAETPVDLPLPLYQEAPIGDLVTDAYRSVVSALDPMQPPALAFDADGQIRAPILEGKTGEIWFTDLFQVLPIGIGPDQVPGFPLVSFYLNPKDIRSGLELNGVPQLVGSDLFLEISGMKVELDASKPPFQRVSRLALVTDSGEQELDVTDTTTCYRVVTTNYVAGLLSLVSSATNGALSVSAKDADCATLIDPTTRYVDIDPTSPGVQELKHWQALLDYVSKLPDTDADGTPDVPSSYGTAQGRIVQH